MVDAPADNGAATGSLSMVQWEPGGSPVARAGLFHRKSGLASSILPRMRPDGLFEAAVLGV